MAAENFRQFIELTLHPMGLLIAVGLVHMLVLEYTHMHKLYKDNMHGSIDWKGVFNALRPRLQYLVGGIIVTISAYIITQVLYRQFGAINLEAEGLNMLASTQYQATGFTLAVAMYVLCGYSLIVSAGNRWFIGLSKLFALIGALIIFALTAGVYLPLGAMA